MADCKRQGSGRLGTAVKVVLSLAGVACGGLTLALFVGRGSLEESSQLALLWLVAMAALSLLLAGLAWTRSSAAAQSVVGGSLTSLVSIDLWNTNVTDAWLPHLVAMGNTTVLIIMRETNVSDEAVGELKKALPNARIVATRRAK